MVETRRSSASSAASKRPASSSSASPSLPYLPKRPKVSEDVLWAEPPDLGDRSCDPQLDDVKAPDAENTSMNGACGTSKPVDDVVTTLGEVILDVGKANEHKRKSLKADKPINNTVWGQILSQSSQREDSSVTVLEISGCKGVVQVNGKIYGRNSSDLLFGGDEVVFSAEGDHSYVFQQFDDNLPYRGLASEFMLEDQSSPMNKMYTETRPGDPSILASLTDFQEDFSLLPPPGQNGVDVQQDSEIPVEQSACGLSDGQLGNTGMRESSNNDDVADVGSFEEGGVDLSTECNEEIVNMDGDCSDASRGAGSEKMPRSKYELKTMLRMRAGSSSSFDLSRSIYTIFQEHRKIRQLLKDSDPLANTIIYWRKAFKQSLKRAI